MVAPEPFFEPRGTCYSVLYRIEALTSLGHEVDLVTYPIGETPEIKGLRVFRSPRVPGIRKIKIGPSFPKLILDLLLFWTTIRVIRRGQYDLIHSHEEASFMAVMLRRIFHLPHIYDMHSSLPQQLSNFGFLAVRPVVGAFTGLEKWALSGSDAVITICPDLRNHVASLKPNVRQVLIENLGDAAPLPPSSASSPNGRTAISAAQLRDRYQLNGRSVVLYTGTFERYQGLDLLLDAARQVVEFSPDVLFLLVGGTTAQIAELRAKAESMGLANHVVFTGTVPQADVPHFLEVADILVSPRTLGTNTPLKIYSYLRSGKPIVATDLWTHTQVLTPEVAVLVAPRPEDFADGILRLIEEPALRQSIGDAARRLAQERYSYDYYLNETRRLYDWFAMPTAALA